jgi:two-component system cell cycle response regulator
MHKILVIEDDQKLQDMYRNLLQHEGFEPVVAGNGPEGLSVLSKNICDLILLDIMLPGGMNGFDILMRLKQNEATKQIPVIVMTNLDSERETGIDMGATDYIIKADIDPQDLIRKIKSHLPQPQNPS